MSTVKISQLPSITQLDTNTINTTLIVVDNTSGVTGKITAQTLGENLYSGDDVLNVGNNITFSDGTIQTTSPLATATYANAAFIQANLAYTHASSAELYANGAFIQSNSAFSTANSAGLYANSAFITANTPSHVANSAALYANGAFIKANAAFIAANTPSETANAALTHAQAAFLTANTPSHVANSAALYANGAFTKANNALANTTGTLAGDLTVTGNVTINYATHINKPDMPGNGIFLLITGSSTGAYGIPSNPGYTIQTVSPDGQGNRVVAEAYSDITSGYASFIARRGRGTAAVPSAVQSGDIIARFAGNGYGSTKFSQFGDGRIEVVATETHTDTSKATKIRFLTTESGTNTATEIASFNGNTASFSGVVSPTKGFIYTPRLPEGNQTSIAIDYSNDSIIKANCIDNISITHSNFTSGKVVEVWLVNSAGQNKTVTHGCSAINSTNKATTATITAGSSMYLRFFSINGDIANTFVSING